MNLKARIHPNNYQSTGGIQKATLTSFLILAFIPISILFVPEGWDFRTNFLPAGRAILDGVSPYQVDGFYSPPWLLVLLTPLALLPERVAWGIFFTLSLFAYVFSLRRMGANHRDLILFMATPFVFYSLFYGNIDVLILLSATFPPAVGVWLLVLKPQMTIGLLILWMIQSFQQGWKNFFWTFGPVFLAMVISLSLGLYRIPNLRDAPWNISTWPFGIVPGAALALLAIKQSSDRLALAAGPFFSPYVAVQSWMVVLLPSLGRFWLVIGFILGWALVILRGVFPAYSVVFEPLLLMTWGILIVFIKAWKYVFPRKNVETLHA